MQPRLALNSRGLLGSLCLPAHSNRDRAQVGGDAAVLAVEIAELGVKLKSVGYLVGQAAAEVLPEFVLAGGKKVAVDGKAHAAAGSPPAEEWITGRARNSCRRVEFARSMEIGRTAKNIPSPSLGRGNIDDGIER